MKHKITKLLEDNTGENLDDPGYDNDILDTTPKAPSMKEIISKLKSLKSKKQQKPQK